MTRPALLLSLALLAATANANIALWQAQSALQAAVNQAFAIQTPMHIAVVDTHGVLVGYYRMDSTRLGPQDISISKARAAALFGVANAQLGANSRPGGQSYTIENSNGRLVSFGGGLPLFDINKQLIGGIGVSSGTVDQDIEVATAGAAAVNTRPSPIFSPPKGNVVGSTITLADTVKMLNASFLAANATGLRSSIAIVDSTSRFVQLIVSTDGAAIGSVDVAIQKASASRLFNRDGDVQQARINPSGPVWRLEVTNNGLVFAGGGVPIQDAAGQAIAAIGVDSGAQTLSNQTLNKAVALAAKNAFGVRPAVDILTRQGISFVQVKRALMGAVARSVAINVSMSIVVLDAGGNLKGLYRLDGGLCLGCMDVAWKKAKTALLVGAASEVIGKLSQPYPTPQDGPLWRFELSNGGLVTFQGGIPIFDGANNLIGAIGASSGTPEQDADVSTAGAKAAVADVDPPFAIPTPNDKSCALTLDLAYKALLAGQRYAEAVLRIDYDLAITDAEGKLKAFWRMDNANLGSIDVAVKKAETAAVSASNTTDFGGLTKPGGPLYSLELANGGMVTFGGGIVVLRRGVVVGGIGTSTGSAQQDHELAAAMLAQANNDNCLLPRPPCPAPVDDDSQSNTVRSWVAALISVLTFGGGVGLSICVQHLRRARKRESLLE